MRGPAARERQNRRARSRDFRGLLRGRFVMWNALVPFTLLVACLAAYRWLPATALFALVVLFPRGVVGSLKRLRLFRAGAA